MKHLLKIKKKIHAVFDKIILLNLLFYQAMQSLQLNQACFKKHTIIKYLQHNKLLLLYSSHQHLISQDVHALSSDCKLNELGSLRLISPVITWQSSSNERAVD